MIAVDTNLLVYAHRRDSAWHEPARRLLDDLTESLEAWAIAWPCIHEFFGTVTHPRVFSPASTIEEALEQVEAWLASPSLVVLAETGDYWAQLRSCVTAGRIVGPRVHDARVAALCQLHGVRELWSADRDFNRFPNLRTRNPLIG